MVSTEGMNLEQICEQYEEMELNTDNEGSKSEVYMNLLAIYLLQNNLIQAKFLWKRIPDNVKSSCLDLESLWKVGQLLWARDFPAVYLALDRQWPSEITQYTTAIKDKLQDRLVDLVSKAYSNIGIEEFSQQLGVNKDEAVELALKHKWEVDHDSGFIHPKLQDHSHMNESSISKEHQLSCLTDYISYLEN